MSKDIKDRRLDPSLKKWCVYLGILSAVKVPQSHLWASFLSLNPLLRRKLIRYGLHNWKSKDTKETTKVAADIANFISCVILFSAVEGNINIPKDYVSVYLWLNYFGTLDHPSSPNILTSKRLSPYFKIDNYKNSILAKIYKFKDLIIFPLIYSQFLSNYLTPTKYRTGVLSSSIKEQILDPIWLNYTLGVRRNRINYLGLLKNYSLHSVMISVFIAVMSFKDKFLDAFYESKFKITNKSPTDVMKNYLLYIGHKTSSIVNFIYFPNLIAMMLISMTAPILTFFSNHSSIKIQKIYVRHFRLIFSGYTKSVAFVSAFLTLYMDSMDFLPDYGYQNEKSEGNIRSISKTFLDALNLYLARLIVLSKWRVAKVSYPNLKLFKITTWHRIEAFVMCLGVYKLMSLYTFIRYNTNIADQDEMNRLNQESLIKAVSRIM